MKKSFIYAGKLLLICAVATLVLAFTNSKTAPVIAERQKQETIAAYKNVYPGAEEITPVEDTSLLNENIKEIQQIKVKGQVDGYAMNVQSPSGYGGPVNFVIGVKNDGTVMGFQVITQSETQGFGAVVADPGYAESMHGAVLKSEVKAGDAAGENTIPAISGATRTTNAVVGGINAVYSVLSQLIGSEAK